MNQNQIPKPISTRRITNTYQYFSNLEYCSSERESRGPRIMVAVVAVDVDVVVGLD
jgi:hypothetical protein